MLIYNLHRAIKCPPSSRERRRSVRCSTRRRNKAPSHVKIGRQGKRQGRLQAQPETTEEGREIRLRWKETTWQEWRCTEHIRHARLLSKEYERKRQVRSGEGSETAFRESQEKVSSVIAPWDQCAIALFEQINDMNFTITFMGRKTFSSCSST
jgi:hypothetical protein